MEDNKLKLNMSLETMNVIMAALGKMPYEAVFAVIDEIRSQVGPQLQAQQSPPPPTA